MQNDLECGDIVAGVYRIDTVLGRGADCTVFSAEHTVTGMSFAVKWLRPKLAGTDATQRLIHEARAMMRVHHPNIVRLRDLECDRGTVFLVMDWCRGVSLKNYLHDYRMDVANAVSVLLPSIRGAAAAHGRRVVHRDVKPENIIVSERQGKRDQETVLIDFGASLIEDEIEEGSALLHEICGTPFYMAPEQIRGNEPVDGRCDQYGFACVLYEMIEGKKAFSEENLGLAMSQKLEGRPAPFRQQKIPRRLQWIIRKALEPSPHRRFANMTEFADVLEPYRARGRRSSIRTQH